MIQTKGLKRSLLDKYYTKRKFNPVLKNNNADSKFVKLSSNRDKLEDVSYDANVKDLDITKKIEKCNILNKTRNCDNLTAESGCGYCFETDTISYGDKNGPKDNVCTKKGWVPPGPQASFMCTKQKEQAIFQLYKKYKFLDCKIKIKKKKIKNRKIVIN